MSVLVVALVLWYTVRPRPPRPIDPSDLQKLEGALLLTRDGRMEAAIHNGSNKRVTEITIELTVLELTQQTAQATPTDSSIPERDEIDDIIAGRAAAPATTADKRWEVVGTSKDLHDSSCNPQRTSQSKVSLVRLYRLTTDAGAPLQDSKYSTTFDFGWNPDQQFCWRMISATSLGTE